MNKLPYSSLFVINRIWMVIEVFIKMDRKGDTAVSKLLRSINKNFYLMKDRKIVLSISLHIQKSLKLIIKLSLKNSSRKLTTLDLSGQRLKNYLFVKIFECRLKLYWRQGCPIISQNFLSQYQRT